MSVYVADVFIHDCESGCTPRAHTQPPPLRAQPARPPRACVLLAAAEARTPPRVHARARRSRATPRAHPHGQSTPSHLSIAVLIATLIYAAATRRDTTRDAMRGRGATCTHHARALVMSTRQTRPALRQLRPAAAKQRPSREDLTWEEARRLS